MGKSKEISQDLRKNIVDLHKSGSSLGARDERTLVQNVQINPRATGKYLVKMLEETCTKVSIKQV